MARRKFRSNQRHEPVTERSFTEYLLSTSAPQTSRAELLRLVRGGEDTYLELKVKLSNTERIAQEIVALANTGGGAIVFGVSDQMRVEGVEHPEAVRDELARLCREEIVPPLIPYIDLIAFDSGRRVVALDIEGKRKPYRTRDGRFYVRFGAEKREATREELAELLDDARPLGYETTPVIGGHIGDIDEAHLWSFVREFAGDAFDAARAGDYSNAEILKRDLLLATQAFGEDSVPTVAGLLLFGKNESVARLLPRASVLCARYAGENVQSPVVETVELKGNLYALYEATLKFITRYCDLWETRPRLFSEQGAESFASRANYQRDAVYEAVANALIHRDLVLRDHPTRILIFDRAVEIINARRANGFAPSSLRAIRYGLTQRLNPQLASYFKSPAYGLTLPRGGLPMLLRESRLFSNRRAEIYAVNDEFRLRLYGIA
jgi:ATP-dependent DNA helicase RecG